MSDLRTAANQMLEALEGGADSWQLVGPAIDALKEALAEPQEPVAKCIDDICSEHLGRVEALDHLPRGTLLYAAPPQRPAKPQGCDHCNHPLYAAVKCKVCGRAT